MGTPLDLGACQIHLPRGWAAEPGDHPPEVLAVLSRPDRHGPPTGRVVITALTAPPGGDGQTAARALAEGAASRAAERGEDLLSLEPLTLAGRPGCRLRTRGKVHQITTYFAVAGRTAYMISCRTRLSGLPGLERECTDLVDSFALPELDTPPTARGQTR